MAQAKIISALPSRRQALRFRQPTLLCDASGICVSVGIWPPEPFVKAKTIYNPVRHLESNKVAQHVLRGYTQAGNGFLHNCHCLVVNGEFFRRDTGTRAASKEAA